MRQLLRLLVLHAPDASEVVVAIRPCSRVVRAMSWAAGVIVNRCLVIKIHEVERPVGSNARVDRPKPEVGSRDKFLLLAAGLLESGVGRAVRPKPIVVHQTDRRFLEEMRAVEFFRPGAAIVDARPRRGREHAHPIDLHVGGPRMMHVRENFLVIRNYCRGTHASHVAAREHLFGHHNME